MNLRFIVIAFLFANSVTFGQTVFFPDYFPLYDGGHWVYQNEFGGNDTATMTLNIPFASDTAISFSYGNQEKQFYSADRTGLYMLGLTIPMGTFSFDVPLGVAGLRPSISDGFSQDTWPVTHIQSGKQFQWGFAQALFDRIDTNVTILDSTYDSVLVISVMCGNNDSRYYLAKGRGIVKSESRFSIMFRSRKLVMFIPPQTSISKKELWTRNNGLINLNIMVNGHGKVAVITLPYINHCLMAKIVSSAGKIVSQPQFLAKNETTLRVNSLPVGYYILIVNDGATFYNRSFKIMK
jgi:hypothetical protein